jgi:ABC-type polysaccharide/polyol phosphate transport system ATPase subunit
MKTEQEISTLEKIAAAGMELAQYASYSEIVGAISHNRQEIREWCDAMYKLHRELEQLKENQSV